MEQILKRGHYVGVHPASDYVVLACGHTVAISKRYAAESVECGECAAAAAGEPHAPAVRVSADGR